MKKKLSSKVTPELEELAEQVGRFVQHWGFKKVHGKIWCHLFLAKHPIDAADLMRRLDISKALVSISLRDLLEYNVVEMVGQSEKGTQLFRANSQVMDVVFNVLRRRERKMLARIHGAFRMTKSVSAKDSTDFDGQKLAELGSLIECAENILDTLLALQVADFSILKKFNFNF